MYNIVVSSQMKTCILLGSVILKVSSMVEKRNTRNVELGLESNKQSVFVTYTV